MIFQSKINSRDNLHQKLHLLDGGIRFYKSLLKSTPSPCKNIFSSILVSFYRLFSTIHVKNSVSLHFKDGEISGSKMVNRIHKITRYFILNSALAIIFTAYMD